MQEVLINFTSNAAGLAPADKALEGLTVKEKALADQALKTSDTIDKQATTTQKSTAASSKSVEGLVNQFKSLDKVAIGGAFKKAMTDITAGLSMTKKELTAFYQNIIKNSRVEILAGDKNEEDLKNLTLLIEQAQAALIAMGNEEGKVEVKSQSMRAQLKALKQDLQNLEDQGMDNTAQFEQMQIQAGKLEDQISDTNARIRALSSDTFVFDALISGVQGIAGAFAVAQGTAALFGSENEDIQKALLKVNAAMAILQGLQQVQNVLQKQSAASIGIDILLRRNQAAATKAQALAMEGEMVATEGAAVAQEGLNVAMKANPAGLILVAITGLITALSFFTGETEDNIEAQKRNIDALNEEIDTIEKLRDLRKIDYGDQDASTIRTLQTELDFLNAQGASQSELIKKKKELADANILAAQNTLSDINAEEEARLKAFGVEKDGMLSNALIEKGNGVALFALINLQRETYSKINDLKRDGRELTKDEQKELDVLEKRAESYAKRVERLNGAQEAFFAANREARKQELEDERTLLESRSKSNIGEAEAEVARRKKVIVDNEIDSIASIQRVTKAEINAINERTKAATDKKLNPNITAGEISKIIAEANLAIAELNKESEQKLLDIQKSAINAKLILSKKASQEEFENNVALLQKQRDIELAQTEVTVEKKNEIEAKFQESLRQLSIKRNIQELDDELSFVDVRLAAFGITEDEKLSLTLKRLELEKNKEIENAIATGAAIAPIIAKYDNLATQAKLDNIDKVKQAQIRAFAAAHDQEAKFYERLANNTQLTDKLRKDSIEKTRQFEQDQLQIEFDALQKKKDQGIITQEEYNVSYQELANKRNDIDQAAADKSVAIDIAAVDRKTQVLKDTLNGIAESIKATLGDGIFSQFVSSFGNGIANAINSLEKMKIATKEYDKIIADGTKSVEERNAATKAKAELEIATIKQVAIDAIQVFGEVSNALFADAAEKRNASLNKQLSDLQDAKSKELAIENQTKQDKANIEARYAQKERQIRLQAFNEEKKAKKAQALINAALGVTLAIASYVWPYNLVVAAITAGLAAVEIDQINAQTPGFKKGKVNIQGPGTTTSDSINARISKGESVIHADATAQWKDPLQSMLDGKFPDWVKDNYQNFVPDIPKAVAAISPAVMLSLDYDKMGTSIAEKIGANLPESTIIHNTIDSDGLHSYLTKGGNRTEFKSKRYSMRP